MTYVSKERLHLARDGKTVVKPGDPRSASLLINEGGQMSDADARKYGLLPPIGSAQGTEDALPIDPLMKQKAEEPPPPPVNTSAPNNITEGFAPNLRFGGTERPTAPPPPPPPPPPPTSPADQSSVLPQDLGGSTPPVGNSQQPVGEELPDDFPYKAILVDAGLRTKTAIKTATKEQLLGVKQIGSERADAIIAAAEKL